MSIKALVRRCANKARRWWIVLLLPRCENDGCQVLTGSIFFRPHSDSAV